MRTPSEPRVIHVVPALFGPRGITGGAERYAFELARAMSRRVPTRLLTFGEQPRVEKHQDLEVRVLGPAHRVRGQEHNPFSLSLLRELPWADVVHCHQRFIVASTVAALVTRARRRRVVVSDLGGGGWDLSLYVPSTRLYHRHLHISEYSRRVYGHEAEPRAAVIYGGIDLDHFSPDESVARRGYALFVGRLLPHKGVDRLIEGLPVGVPLRVLGTPMDTRYMADLRELARGKHVEFVHGADEAALLTAYREAACVVLPSLYRDRYGRETAVPELLGQTLLEGMACATPGVCTDVASLPEVVVDGSTGFVVPPDQPEALGAAVARLCEDRECALAMGSAARARAAQSFSWSSVVDRCLDLYRA